MEQPEGPRGLNPYFRQNSIFHLNCETSNVNETGKESPPVNILDTKPPLVPRNSRGRVPHLVEQHESDHFNCSMADDVTDALTSDWITSPIYDLDNTAKLSLFNISDSSENDSKIGNERDIPNTLYEFFEDDLFRSELKNNTLEFRKDIEEVATTEGINLTMLTDEATHNSQPHLKTDSLPIPYPTLMEKQEGPRGLNHYFRQESIFHLNCEAPNVKETGNEAPDVTISDISQPLPPRNSQGRVPHLAEQHKSDHFNCSSIYDFDNTTTECPHLTTDSLFSMSNPTRMEMQEGPRGFKDYFRQDSIFNPNHVVPNQNEKANEMFHRNKSFNFQTDANECEDNNSDHCKITDDTTCKYSLGHYDTPSANDVYVRKLRRLEQEVNQLERSLCDEYTAGKITNTSKRKLSAQRSLSDSDISELVDADKGHSIPNDKYQMAKSSSTEDIEIKTRCNTIKNAISKTKFPSLEDITLGAKELWSNIKTASRNSYEPPTNLEIKVDAHVKLSCPCDGSCRRVGRIVATHGGYIWVSFTKCSWVALYNHRHVKVFMLDTRGGYVDSLAVSKAGGLYITCPPQRRILMLSTNLELTELGVFNTLYPRGLAVSPEDYTIVVCMVPHLEGRDMCAPSKDSCLMRFTGQKSNELGTIVNMDSYFGYPMKVVINVNGVLLVSDFGLKCLFVLDKGGHMLRTFSVLGGAGLSNVHALACNPGNSFFVVQGGSGTLSITELVNGNLGIFEEKSTSKKDVKSIKRNVVTSSMVKARKIALASGNAIIYVSLV
ncbi:uncharacterized protein LOC117317659 [Pecten maximus]|uniref:uncharacterized protein LOC117317659 n=1 Tax=Pecten maximus TaxID=6579 RepID=UPI0014589671|nr:uncharacterized protein LOC117317659 [Pecten maximus]XP_033728417.1 uncharacterized protein LOC117317659 [Pecten maximus]